MRTGRCSVPTGGATGSSTRVSRRFPRRVLRAAAAGLWVVALSAQTGPPLSREYIRLGGRVIAIENAGTITAVQVAPAAVTLAPNQTRAFTATVTGTAADKSVTWSITPGTGAGVIDPDTGRYAAPAVFTSAQTVTVKAASRVNASKYGTAVVTLQPLSVTVTPGYVSMMADASQVFTASVAGASNQNVTWSLVAPAQGTIDPVTGLYKAPKPVTGSQTDTVKALSAADSASFGLATVTLLPSASLSIAKAAVGTFTQGQQYASYTITVSNSAAAGPSSGTVTVTDVAPTGLTVAEMSGTGWACTAPSCQRSDVLNAGASYPPITALVNVAADAPASITNVATVSGGGSAGASAAAPTTVGAFVNTISPARNDSFPAAGGTALIGVTTAQAWTVQDTTPGTKWLTLVSPVPDGNGVGHGSGPGTIRYSAGPNHDTAVRQGSLQIYGSNLNATFIVTQAPTDMLTGLSPGSVTMYPGESWQFNAYLNGSSVPANDAVTWSAVDGSGAAYPIPGGLIQVPAAGFSTIVSVRATLKADPTQSRSATVVAQYFSRPSGLYLDVANLPAGGYRQAETGTGTGGAFDFQEGAGANDIHPGFDIVFAPASPASTAPPAMTNSCSLRLDFQSDPAALLTLYHDDGVTVLGPQQLPLCSSGPGAGCTVGTGAGAVNNSQCSTEWSRDWTFRNDSWSVRRHMNLTMAFLVNYAGTQLDIWTRKNGQSWVKVGNWIVPRALSDVSFDSGQYIYSMPGVYQVNNVLVTGTAGLLLRGTDIRIGPEFWAKGDDIDVQITPY